MLMAKHMPEPMQNAGLSMHTAASEVARTAATRDNMGVLSGEDILLNLGVNTGTPKHTGGS